MKEISAKIASGAIWTLFNLLLTRSTSILFTLLLTRLLAPEAFGTIAMMSVFFELANMVVNSGLQQALIRSATVSDTDLSTAFFSNIVFSTLAYVSLFVVAPLAAAFYEKPELTNLIRVAGIVLFVNSLILVQEALLRRQMQFRTLMYATLTGTLASGLFALGLAYLGFGIWSLVAQMVSGRLFVVTIIWLRGDWRPNWEFSQKSFSRMFQFGYKLLLESTIDILYRNSFVVVIGKLFSAELVGLYFLATRINDLAVPQIAGAVSQASFPALSTIQDRPDDLREMYRRIIRITMLLVTPIIAGMAVLSPLAFDVFMEPRWRLSAVFLQVISLTGLFFPLHLMNYNILNIKGRSDLVLFLGIIRKSVNFIVLLLCIRYGVFGILIGQLITSIIALIPNTFYTSKLIGYNFTSQINDIAKPIFSASVSSAIIKLFLFLFTEKTIFIFLSSSFLGIVSYIIISRMICKEEFMMLKRQIMGNSRIISNIFD